MQFNGIGQEHGAEMHHVTNCMHDHSHFQKLDAAGGMAASAMESQAMEGAKQQPEGQMSLSAWLERYFSKGKRFFRGIWNGSEDGNAEAAQVLARMGDESRGEGANVSAAGQAGHQPDSSANLHTAQVAAASAAVTPSRVIQENPYFSAIESSAVRQESMWQKVKVRFKDIAGQLTGHLPGNSMNAQAGSSFQAKQERPKEDLRKHSKFREDDLEIDCILTDDSYLLDSYDRKGEYSKLSAKK